MDLSGPPRLLVDVCTFGFIFLIANISTDFAFKIQYVVLAIIGLSLKSIGLGFVNNPVNTDIRWFGQYEGSIENGFSTAMQSLKPSKHPFCIRWMVGMKMFWHKI